MNRTYLSGFTIPDQRTEPETPDESLAYWNRVLGVGQTVSSSDEEDAWGRLMLMEEKDL